MRRSVLASLSMASFAGVAFGQTPLMTRDPVKIGAVRGGNGVQPSGYAQPQPMPMGTTPMGSPMSPATPMGIPSATQPSVQLGQPKELGSTPGVAIQPGSTMGTVITDPMMTPGMPMMPVDGGSPGVPNNINGPFTYLNDAPLGGMPMGTGYEVGGPLLGRPFLGRFVQPGKWYGSAEYLAWYMNGNPLPPLLTTSNTADNGFLGSPSTRVLVGNDDVVANQRNGGRFNLGYWFGCDQCRGIDASYFFLGSQNETITVASNGDPLLARPFLNANTNQQFSQIIAYPGQSSGVFSLNTESSLWGADINYRKFLMGNACRRIDTLIGFRYLNLDERLTIREDVNRINGGFAGIVPGVGSAVVIDSFQTGNQFYGPQFGLTGEFRRGRWFLDSNFKLGLGVMHQTLKIDGSQTLTTANGTTTVPGGLLALPDANIGSYSQNKFAVVPEVGVNIGYHLTSNCRLFVGYNFLYASSVLRPGDQIDTRIDVTRIPNFPTTATRLTEVHPQARMNPTDVVVQGLNVGIQFKW